MIIRSYFKTQKSELPTCSSLASGEAIPGNHSYFCSKSASWCVLKIPVLCPSPLNLLLAQYLNCLLQSIPKTSAPKLFWLNLR